MTTNSQFFDDLSDDYDLMINFDNALKNKIVFLKNFKSLQYKTALDLGCGTGADAIALSKLNLDVDAIDHSKGMLAQALLNAQKYDVTINFMESSLTTLPHLTTSYDFIVSLGNTIANINKHDLSLLISKLYGLLNDGGSILIQIINYEKLPSKGIHILNVFENDSVSITRKYDIQPNHIDFIIDKVDKDNKEAYQIITPLYPHSKSDFETMASKVGLSVAFYGNLKKDEFDATDSANLVAVLTKG